MLPFPACRILARTLAEFASKMVLNGFPFGGFTMGATGPAGMDVSLDDMIKQVRLPFFAPAPKRHLKRSFQEDGKSGRPVQPDTTLPLPCPHSAREQGAKAKKQAAAAAKAKKTPVRAPEGHRSVR